MPWRFITAKNAVPALGIRPGDRVRIHPEAECPVGIMRLIPRDEVQEAVQASTAAAELLQEGERPLDPERDGHHA